MSFCIKHRELYPEHCNECLVEDLEAPIEQRWREQKGVDPETGAAWLTPRMERNAARLVAHWEAESK